MRTRPEALLESRGYDIINMTEFLTGYINFCVETIITTKGVNVFPSNKPWIISDLKILLNTKKKVFRVGDRELWKSVQK